VVVAQLVRAPDCGSGGRRFEPGLPPRNEAALGKLKRLFAFLRWELFPVFIAETPNSKIEQFC
jgi:hypothetical protein